MRPTYLYPPPRRPTVDVELLKPCPFCGRKPVAASQPDLSVDVVRCVYHTMWLLPVDWNLRSDAPPVLRPGVPLLTPPEEP